MKKANKVQLPVRIHLELLEECKKKARGQNRSLTNYVETALMSYSRYTELDKKKIKEILSNENYLSESFKKSSKKRLKKL